MERLKTPWFSMVKVFLVANMLTFTEQTFACETSQICCHTRDNIELIDILMLVLKWAELRQNLDESLVFPQINAYVYHVKCLPSKFYRKFSLLRVVLPILLFMTFDMTVASIYISSVSQQIICWWCLCKYGLFSQDRG